MERRRVADQPAAEHLPGIEGLRALAAAAVLVYHVWRFGAPDGHSADAGALSPVMPHLWHGVTLFFVLSGFLLYRPFAAAILRGTRAPSLLRYIRRRGLRILPAYWVILLLTAFVLQTALVPAVQGPRTEGALDGELLALNLLFLQNLSADTIFTGLGPAWSLSVEVAFYLLLPLLAVLALGLAAGGRRPLFAVAAPAALLLALGLSGKVAMLTVVDWQLGVARSLWGLADLFALGMVVAIVAVAVEDGRLTLPPGWRAGAGAGVVALVTLTLVAGGTNLVPGAPSTLGYNVAVGIACALVLALVVLPGRRGSSVLVRLLDSRIMVAGGLISYSAFLWHEPLLRWLRLQGATADGGAGFALNVAVVTLATGVLAALTYRFVEAPALRLRVRRGWWRLRDRAGRGGLPRAGAGGALTVRRWLLALGVAGVLVLGGCSALDSGDPASESLALGVPERPDGEEPGVPAFSRLEGLTTARAFGDELGEEGLERWEDEVEDIEDVRIDASGGGKPQPALWLPPSGEAPGEQPLLVLLHSWSNGYKQHIGIPFAEWAQDHGWAMIAPHFRGKNTKSAATGSDRAVQDVVDAIDFAIEDGDVDPDRVFVIGFSGGGMMSLLMAGRHPDRIAGAVSWVPVHDLNAWHEYNAGFEPPRDYARHIETSCQGDPSTNERARRRCARRSPSEHLGEARRAGVPIYIAHGIDDSLVPPYHALEAFNQLAGDGGAIGERSLDRVADNDLPDHLRGSIDAEHFFGEQDPDVVFSRRSGATTVVLFEGEHDMIYNPGLAWITAMTGR